MVVSNVVKGYYFRLKDKSTPLNLKLKLIRYAWNNDSIVIANKVQVLLDCIGGILIQKKRNGLSEEDVGAVWECLDWLLLSNKVRRCHETLVLKPSFSQVVIQTVNRLSTEVVPYRSSILGCCRSLFMSPALTYLFTSNIENVVSMLSVICTVSIQELNKTGSFDPCLQELLSILTEAYKKRQRTNSNQKQIYGMFCDKLFLPCVILIYLCKPHPEFQGISSAVTAIMKNTLLDKDQFMHYNSYLKITCNIESNMHMPKNTEKFFSLLEEGLSVGHDKITSAAETRSAILNYLPIFFASYLQGEMHNSESCRMMFFALNKQIGISVEKSSLSGVLEESDVLIVLDCLLKQASEFNIYDVGQDNAEDGIWLLYFTMLLKLLLTMKSKTSSWYSCLETLIKLNPEITEDHLSSIFATCWHSISQFDSSETDSVDSFMSTVFNIYHKLRKVPTLIDIMTKSVEDSSGTCCIQFPQKAYTKFQDVIQLLPQTIEIAILEKLVTVIQEKLTEVINTKDSNASAKCAMTMNLLVHFLHHCVVVGATVTTQTTQRVQELMVQMKETILSTSVTYCITQPICDQVLLEATLLLTHAWGELALLLAHFVSSDVQPQFKDPLTFQCFSSRTWKKILKHLNKGTFIANLQQLQRIKAAQVFPDSLSEEEATQVFNVDDILKPLFHPESLETTDKAFKFSQFYTHTGLSVKTRRQANWLLITANLPLLMPFLNQDQLHKIAEIVLDTFQDDITKSKDQLETFLTQKLLKDSSFQEMKQFHSCLVSSTFSKLSSLATIKEDNTSESVKKQKVSLVDIAEIFTKLGDKKLNWCQSQKKAAKCLRNIGEDVCSLLESLPVVNKTGQYVQQNSATYIQVLQSLPLRFMSSNDQNRAIMGLQVLLACNPLTGLVNPVTEDKESCQQLSLSSIQSTMACLQTLFFSSGDNSVFFYLNPEAFLNYLKTIFNEVKQESDGACKIPLLISIHRLIEGTFFALVNEQKNFPALQSYISKLCKSLKKAHKKLSKNPEDVETFDKKYSLTYLLATILVEVLGKKIRICIWKKNVKDEAIGYLGELSKNILDSSSYVGNELPSFLIAAYSSVLIYHESLPDSNKDIVNKLWKNVSTCCSENLLHKKDISLLHLSVQFYFTSLNQTHTAQLLDTESRQNTWQALYNLLYTFLSEQNSNSNGCVVSTDHKSRDAASLDVDLNFVGHIYSKKSLSFDFDNEKQSSLKSQLITFLIEQIKSTMGVIILTSENDELNFYFEKMLSNLTAEMALTDTMRLKSTVDVSLALFDSPKMKDEHLPRFISSQCDILRYSQTLFQQMQWHIDLTKMETVVIPLLRLEAKILQKYKNTLSSQAALQVMFGCQYVRLNELPVSTFCAVFHALCDVLFSLLLDFNRAVLATLPGFIGVLKRLLVSVCQEGSQDVLAKKPKAVQPISDCAQYLTRLISLLSNNKTELSKLVSHLIADYLAAIQQTTLLPSVKSSLDNGLYILLAICDQHAIQNLMVELPEGLKHVFRSVHNKYVQNYKYAGNI